MNDKSNEEEGPESNNEVLGEGDSHIDICVGVANWVSADGRFILEEDFKVSGEVWRIHKNDADPYPSNPHAHCVGGADRFIGRKLHLGTGELYSSKNDALGRFLHKKQFNRLIELAQKNFLI